MAKQKLNRAEFIAAHPKCCYCAGRRPTAEIDHAPARIVFVKKHGPEGFEFPSCSECNRLTALSEQIAAFYIRTFDADDTDLDEGEFLKLTSGITNNAPDALPKFQLPTTYRNPMLDPTGVAQRTMTVPDVATAHMKLFALKVLYAIYYKTTGRFAGSTNRYLLQWAQAGTEAAASMTSNGNAWFDEHVVGARRSVDLGNQFKYQTGYNPLHGFFGIKMEFAGSFVFFGVIGPARDLNTIKPKLAICPAISDAAKRLTKRKV